MDNSTSFVSVDDLRNESTLTLMEYMGMTDEEPAVARLAFRVFYEKFAPSFKAMCLSACSNFNNLFDGLGEVVFNNALLQAFQNAGQFHSESKEERQVVLDVKKWLNGIAKNELYIELRKIKTYSSNLSIVEDIMVYESPLDEDPELKVEECVETNILNTALATLDEKERGILLMCYQYMKEGSKIPSDAIERICKVFGVKDANRRQIKTRALKKLNEQIKFLESKIKVKK